MPLLGLVLLTAGNAFFVAAEFSLVTVNRAEIDRAADGGDTTAVTVRKALRELSFQLSGAQVGITITALLTGYLAEPALARLFRPLLTGLGGAADGVAAALALGLATAISVLFGELVPKNLAIARPMPTARTTAGPQRLFTRVFGWLIRALNGSANWLVRRLGVTPQEELASARSPEELGMLAAHSARAGQLPEATAALVRRTIRFGEKRADVAMTPRVDVKAIEATESVESMLTRVRDTGLSRFPVYEGTLDEVVGVVTLIDALRVLPARRARTTVGHVARDAVRVSQTFDLDRVLVLLQEARADFGIVVDEYGGTDGVITIEDLVEELVGEITDEHELLVPSLGRVVPHVDANGLTVPGVEHSWQVDGVVRADELAEVTGFRLPKGKYETLAGFLLARLGHIPAADESVREGPWEFTVMAVDRHRIEQVRVARVVPADD